MRTSASILLALKAAGTRISKRTISRWYPGASALVVTGAGIVFSSFKASSASSAATIMLGARNGCLAFNSHGADESSQP